MTFLPVDLSIDQKSKERHRIDTLNLLAYVSLLVLVLVTTWFLKRRKRLHLHETGLAIVYGLLMGALLRYFGLEITISAEQLRDTIPLSVPADYVIVKAKTIADTNQTHFYAYEFRGEIKREAKLGSQISYASVNPEVFFNIILPPIVLNAGLSLKRRHFFRNIGAIFCYAFIGTTISVASVGSLIYAAVNLMRHFLGSAYLAERFTLANCLYFGAIISPTDPLAVLAIFQELGVDVNLFALVFGESILNDAVSIVLTHSIGHFATIYEQNLYSTILSIVWQCAHAFVLMFSSSCLIGIAFGIVTALTTKFTKLTESPLLESSLVVLMSYSAFLAAEVADASGIVAILLCGITQAHYTINNLSFEARERLKSLFELLTFLCENFLFLAVGVSFWQRGQTWDLSFVGVAFGAITLARALSVYPLTALLNLGRRNKIPLNFQHLLTWGGAARGVISYSLAARNTVGDARQIMLSTTSVIVIVSVIAVGSLAAPLLRWLRIPHGPQLAEKQLLEQHEHEREHDDLDVHDHRQHYQHSASMSAISHPGWLVRPKRLSRLGLQGAELGRAQARASPLATATTPVLEIETGIRQQQHQQQQLVVARPAPSSQANSSFDRLEILASSPPPLATLAEAAAQQDHGAGERRRSQLALCAPASSLASSLAGLDASLEASSGSLGRHHSHSHRDRDRDRDHDQDQATRESQSGQLAVEVSVRGAYENAQLVRRWRSIDNNFIKPLLTNAQPTLMDTMPSSLRALARLFTSDEQLMRQRDS